MGIHRDDSKRTLYDTLGVSPTATQTQIKSAYRSLSKLYHPDVNPSPDATSHMKEINSAYAILSDPAKRAAYDTSLRLGEIHERETVDSTVYAESFVKEVSCQRCGRFDHTLRAVAFPYVVSFLIMSYKGYDAGIYCDHCRAVKSAKYAAISLLFGIWGIPFGIFWTIESLIINARKGKIPAEENRPFVQELVWANLALGKIGEAKAALRDLLKYGVNEQATRLKQELDDKYPSVKTPKASGFRYGFTAIVLSIFILFGLAGYAIFGQSSETNNTVKLSPTQQAQPPSNKFKLITPKQAQPPDESFLAWQDNSVFISQTSVRIKGVITNTHTSWSVNNVGVNVKMLV